MDEERERELLQYQVLTARLNNWYQLLWQVPLFAFTAQAFTFTIALDPAMTFFGRVVACLLSILISLVSLITLVRQRKADRLDAGRLEEIEKGWGWAEVQRLHGKPWATRRKDEPFDWRWLDKLVGKRKLTGVWAAAFLVLLAIAIAVLAVQLVRPEWLSIAAAPVPVRTP